MRLNINLATHPYQDMRRFLFRWGGMLAALAIITIALLGAATSTLISWRKTTRQIGTLRGQIENCDREQANAKALLDRPENRATRDKSRFINELIARKAFSWTEVLTDLEAMLPSGIQIVSITPSINDNNQLELRLAAAGPSRDRAVELVSNLEKSRHFRNAILRNDIEEKTTNEARQQMTNYRFEIYAIYVPSYQADTAQPMVARREGR